jgi:hypothetical protein
MDDLDNRIRWEQYYVPWIMRKNLSIRDVNSLCKADSATRWMTIYKFLKRFYKPIITIVVSMCWITNINSAAKAFSMF